MSIQNRNIVYVDDTSDIHTWKTYCSVACAKKSGAEWSNIVPVMRVDYNWLYGNNPSDCDNCGEPLWE